MGAVFYILLGWGLAGAGCWACGALLLQKLRVSLTREEALAMRFVAGATLYSTLIFFLGVGHLLYKGIFIAVPLALMVWAWKRGALTLPKERLEPIPLWWGRLLWAVGIGFGVLYFFNAMAPEASPDGTTYHLGLVARYYREHALTPVPTNIYAAMTQGIEMLFLAAYGVGKHSAAAMMHMLYLFALPWLMLCYGRRHGMTITGAAAAVFVFCSPVVGIDGISAYNDVAAACVLFALFSVLRRMEQEPSAAGWSWLAGILAGFAFAIKYTLFPAPILAAAWTAWVYRGRLLAPLSRVVAAASVLIVPYLVRNTIWYYNPLAPFLNKWFPTPFVLWSFEQDYKHHMSVYSLQSLWEIPMEVAVVGGQLNGLLGPLFLLAPLGLLALRHAEGRRLLVAAAFFLSTYFTNIGTRFLIPPLPFVAMAMALVFAQWRWVAMGVAVVHVGLSLPDAIPLYANEYSWRLDRVPWKWALRIRSEEDFLAPRVRAYSISRRMEEMVPDGRRVLGYNQVAEAYMSREYLVSFQSAEGSMLRDIMTTPIALERRPTMRVVFHIRPQRVRGVRIVMGKDDPSGVWSVSEMRVNYKNSELTRSPLWRIRAHPRPYEVGAAFDNSYVTRWISDYRRAKGMFLEADFGTPQWVDSVSMQMTPDQPWEPYYLEVMDAEGKWAKEPARLEPQETTTPAGLRRAAIDELLRRNVQYLIMYHDDHGANDLILNRGVWGVEELANEQDIRLYRLLARDEFDAQRAAEAKKEKR